METRDQKFLLQHDKDQRKSQRRKFRLKPVKFMFLNKLENKTISIRLPTAMKFLQTKV